MVPLITGLSSMREVWRGAGTAGLDGREMIIHSFHDVLGSRRSNEKGGTIVRCIEGKNQVTERAARVQHAAWVVSRV
jgi:hypothetical protein